MSRFEILCLVETWLSDSIFNNEILPKGYTLYRKDRSHRGGGVLIAVSTLIPSYLLPTPEELEVISVVLQLQQDITLCTIYIPPGSQLRYIEVLCSYITSLSSSASTLVIVGDFNQPDVCWLSLRGSCPSSNLLCNTIFECNLSQLVTVPTHTRGNMLDLIFTNDEDIVDELQVHPETDSPFLTDHYMITCSLRSVCVGSPCVSSSIVFDYSRANWEEFCDYLLDCDFSVCLEDLDVELIWATFKLIVSEAMSKFIPQIQLRKYQFPRWFTPILRHKHKCLHTIEKKYNNSPSEANLNKFREAKASFILEAESAKAVFESGLINEFATSKSSKIYKYIGNLKKGGDIPSTVYLGSQSASSASDKANFFNTYFHSVFTDSTFEIPELPVVNPSISNIQINDSEVYDVLTSLDTTKAQGLDGIGPSVLKFGALALYQPLHHLFSLCLSQHCIPTEWKIHGITPIHKSGERGSVSNYRPISLLSSTSKVLERLIYNKLMDFLYQSITPVQFGFLKEHSSLQQLLLFYNNIMGVSKSCSQWDVLFLDFAKAFDSVAHNELLLKLANLGVSGDLWLWLHCYLSKRFQCVCIEECRSDLLPVVSGVPQGSILGPLLFLVFINDLPAVVRHSSIFLFADDSKCAKQIHCLQDCVQLQEDLDSMSNWSVDWKLQFKASKCVLLRFCNRSTPIHASYSVNDKEIAVQDSYKDLGVMFSSDLTFSVHYDLIVKRAYRVLGLLRRTFSFRTCVREKLLLYVSLVRSQMIYCSPIWRPYLVKDIVILERVQRRATKYILNDYRSNYRTRLMALNLLPLMYIFELRDIMFCVKSLKSPSRDFNIKDFVTFSSGSTRSSAAMKMLHTHCSTNSARHFYFFRLPRLWNKLPPIDLDSSIETIRTHLHAFLYKNFREKFDSLNSCTNHFLCPCSKCGYYVHPPHF